MDKKSVPNLSGLVTVKGEAKPIANIPTRSQEESASQEIDTQIKETINDTPLNFKVSADFRKRFKTFAVDNDLKQYELLILAFEEYVKNHQK